MLSSKSSINAAQKQLAATSTLSQSRAGSRAAKDLLGATVKNAKRASPDAENMEPEDQPTQKKAKVQLGPAQRVKVAAVAVVADLQSDDAMDARDSVGSDLVHREVDDQVVETALAPLALSAPAPAAPVLKRALAKTSSVSSMSSMKSSDVGVKPARSTSRPAPSRSTSVAAPRLRASSAAAGSMPDTLAKLAARDTRLARGMADFPAKAAVGAILKAAGAGASHAFSPKELAAVMTAANACDGQMKKELANKKLNATQLERLVLTLSKKNVWMQACVAPQLNGMDKEMLIELSSKLNIDYKLLAGFSVDGEGAGAGSRGHAATVTAANATGAMSIKLGLAMQEQLKLSKQIQELQTSLSSIMQERVRLSESVAAESAKCESLAAQLEEERVRLGADTRQAVESAEAAVTARFTVQLDQLRASKERLDSACSDISARLAAKEAELTAMSITTRSKEEELGCEMEGAKAEIALLQAASKQRDDLLQEQEAEMQDLFNEVDALRMTVQELTDEKVKLQEQDTVIQSQLQAAREAEEVMQDELSSARSFASTAAATAASTIAKLQAALAKSQADLIEVEQEAAEAAEAAQEERAAAQAHVAVFESKYRAAEAKRVALVEQVLTLKGAIRVVARVRPALPAELAGGTAGVVMPSMMGKSGKGKSSSLSSTSLLAGEGSPLFHFPDASDEASALEVHERPGAGVGGYGSAAAGKVTKFDRFNRVFPPTATNSDLFQEVESVVESSLNGSRVCIFAYGQTGSGKTHTMQGKMEGEGADPGLIPRSLDHLFARAAVLRSSGWTVSMTASMLEIYNEQARDLLTGAEGKKVDLDVLPTKDGSGFEAKGLSAHPVSCPADVSALLALAASARATSATGMNAHSSRSHAVFTLAIKCSNMGAGAAVHCSGLLHLVDLAGSERLEKSGVEGELKKETAAINSSLSQLALVIRALQVGDKHIPYRNSALTKLLQSSLGGEKCKTLLVAALNPLHNNVHESLSTLRFASDVAKVETASR